MWHIAKIAIKPFHYSTVYSNPNALKACAHVGCSNRDTNSICLNHGCCICQSYPKSDVWTGTCYGKRIMKSCALCGQCYCVIKSNDGYDDYYDSKCGSVKSNKCKKCYLKKKADDLKVAIYENTPFYDDIALHLFAYAA